MGRRRASVVEQAQDIAPSHSLAAWKERADAELDAKARADTEAMASVHRIARDVADMDPFMVEGIAVPMLSMVVEADAVRSSDGAKIDGEAVPALVRLRNRYAKRASRDPDAKWRDEIEALRSWRPGADRLVPRVPHVVGERSTKGEGQHRLPSPDPHFVALGKALRELSPREISVLTRCYVDHTGELSGNKMVSAQSLARGIRDTVAGNATVSASLPPGSLLEMSEAIRWPEIVAEADGRLSTDLREQLKRSALTVDEMDRIERDVLVEATRVAALARAFVAHTKFMAAEVSRETNIARRKLRKSMLRVRLDVTPPYLLSHGEDSQDEVEAVVAPPTGRVCYGAEVLDGLRGACNVQDAIVPSASAICRYCKRPTAN